MNAQAPMPGARRHRVRRPRLPGAAARHSTWVILWSLVIGHWSSAQTTNLPPATVSFLDGSFLRGEVVALDGETLRWRHPNARQPIEFTTTNLNLIRLPASPQVAITNTGQICRVVLAGGDEFEGRLLSLDSESFEVETWFAGRLRGRRAGLASLVFASTSHAAYYEGPRAAEEWKSSAAGSGAVNRAGVDVLGGGNFIFRQNIQLAPDGNPAPRVAVERFRVVEPEPRPPAPKGPAPQEVVTQLKAELASLGEKVSPAVKQALEKRLKEAEELAAKAPAPSPKVADIMKLVEAAQKSAATGEFLKSDLVRAAVTAGLASERALERWLADYEHAADFAKDPVKAARFKGLVRAEAALLGGRLIQALGPGQGEAEARELDRVRAEAVAAAGAALAMEAAMGAAAQAQANALAEARARALGALRANDANLALGAEGVLAGRAAISATNNLAWVFRDGAYYSTAVGTLGRECLLPTRARVEFDLAWKGQPYFRFSLYTRSTEHFDYSDGWQFYTSSSGYIYSMRRSGMGATSSSGARVPQMLSKNTVRLTLLVNSEAETVTLLADGEKVHEWKALGSPGNGTGIVFYNYNGNSRVRVSDIRIAPWDGRVDRAEPPGTPGTDPDQLVEVPPPDTAVVEFLNQDRATGALHGIRDGKLVFNPAGSKLEVPLTRASMITFPVSPAPEPPPVAGVQVTLHRNERLTLALEKWAAGEISAVSPVFGRLKLRPDSVRSLRFNPAAPRGPADEWSGP